MSDIQTYNTQKLIKKILFSILLSFGTIIGIFLFTSFRGVTIDFSTFKPFWILAGIASIVTAWLADALRLYLTSRAWNKKITYRNSLTGVLSCYFISSITPSATGGSPAEMLILTRSGLSWGEAGCLTAICGILFQLTLLILLLILIFIFKIQFALYGMLRNLLYSFILFYSILMFLLFFFLNHSILVFRMVNWGMSFARRRFPRFNFSEEKVLEWVKEFFTDFKIGFRLLFIEKPQYLLLNIAGYSLYFIFYFLVAYFTLRALGIYIDPPKVIANQIPLHLIFGFLPTPGATGGVELSIGSVFISSTGPEKISLFILFWRLITYYSSMMVGAFTFFRVLFIMGKERIPNPQMPVVDDKA